MNDNFLDENIFIFFIEKYLFHSVYSDHLPQRLPDLSYLSPNQLHSFFSLFLKIKCTKTKKLPHTYTHKPPQNKNQNIQAIDS